MAARNMNSKPETCSSYVVYLRLFSATNAILLAVATIFTYGIHKLGYAESGLLNSEDKSHELPSPPEPWFSNLPILYWWYSTDSSENKPLQELYPTTYSIVKTLDYLTSAVFHSFDCLVFNIYGGICYISTFLVTQTVKLVIFMHHFVIDFWEYLYPENLFIGIKSTLVSIKSAVSDIQISSGIIITVGIICSIITILGVIQSLRRSYSSSHKKPEEFVQDVSPDKRVVRPRVRGSAVSQGIQSAPIRRKIIPVKRTIFAIIGLCFMLSLPWEFIRLYQAEVAKKASVTLKGAPPECVPGEATLWQSLKIWLSWQFSWQQDPCEKYHHALLVDPLWEVSPMLVLSSMLSRCITAPAHHAFSALGTSLRALLQEIPAHWQLVVMTTIILISILLVLMVCSYRVSMPMFLRIEPCKKTPVIIKTCGSKRCLDRAREQYMGREILSVELMNGNGQLGQDKGNELANCSQLSDSQVSEWDF